MLRTTSKFMIFAALMLVSTFAHAQQDTFSDSDRSISGPAYTDGEIVDPRRGEITMEFRGVSIPGPHQMDMSIGWSFNKDSRMTGLTMGMWNLEIPRISGGDKCSSLTSGLTYAYLTLVLPGQAPRPLLHHGSLDTTDNWSVMCV